MQQMQYARKLDLPKLMAATSHASQTLIDKDTGGTTCKILVVKSMPGDVSRRGMHTHPFDQIYYILSGKLRMEVNGTDQICDEGTLIPVPQGTPHRNSNPFEEPAVWLNILTPLSAWRSE